ncbi:MAG: alpha/beta fold hydrolase [Nevskia sp.]|nr:alpha/beta fold hydrolase [Nevskia sp.]
MLAIGVLFLTLGEFCLYLGAGLWLWHERRWPLLQVVGLMLGCAVGIRALITAYLFAITESFRSPRPAEARLGPVGAIGLFLRELLALSSLYTTVHALDRWLGLPDPPIKRDDEQPPVLLLHGFFCNSAYWWILRRQLRRLGYDNVFTQTLEPVFGDIERLGEQVGERVEVICAATGADKLVIVAHSMGGLASRAYLRRHGPARVLKLIAVGTPHHGTVLARSVALLGKNLQQMRLNSPWLQQLNAAPPPVPIVNIWSYHDNIVSPQDSCTLPGAKNLAVAGIGHLEMAIAPSVRTLILEELRQL